MATKQFQNAKLNVTHLDLKDDASRSVLQSGENISHSLGKIARWYKDIIWTDSKATTEVFGIVKLSDDYKSESTETVPTSKTLNDVVKLIKQTGGWNTTYDFNSNIDGDENLQNGQFKVTEHDLEGDIDHYVSIKGLGSAAYTESSDYATAGHTHMYAGSDSVGGVANSAAKLSDIPAGGIGSETKPVFFSGTTGRPVACTYSLNATVPANAIFTDEKVKQSPVTTDGSFEVLFAGSTGNTEKTEGVGKTTTLTFNPSTGALSATSFSGNGSGLTSLNASNISSGTLAVDRLPGSAVTIGTYGPAAGGTLSHSGTFDVPDFTVDAKGRVTGAHTRTFTLPAQYTHPTHTSKTSGLYKITVDSLGHVSGTAAVTKSDIPALDYISSTTTRNPNVVLAGPASGTTAAAPTFRALVVADLPASGATAGSYGPSANATPGYGATFNVPYITIDAKGRVTGIENKTVKIPASDNTNTTYTLSGAYGSSSNTWVTTLTPSSGSATTSTVPTGSTSAYGLMKLYNGVDSTSTALAATANAVKTAYDKANHSHPYVKIRDNGYSYNNLASFYNGSTLKSYIRITVPKGSSTWTMCTLEITLKANYSSGLYGKILFHGNWSSSSDWNNLKAEITHNLGTGIKMYASDKTYIYISGHGSYATCTVDKMTIGDNAVNYDLSAVTIDQVDSLPSTYQTVSMTYYANYSITGHTHTKSQITDFPSSIKNPNALTVQGNGTTSISYDGSAAKTLNIKPGTGISVSSDTSGNITITNTSTNTDTKNTAGSTNTSSKIFLIGATSQAANPQTYSHDTAYVGTDGCLYSNSKKVSVEGHTHSYLPLAGGTMTGDITFAGVSSTTYPALSNQIYFSGSTDWARILYEVTASDAGQLVFETGDDANAKIVFRNKVTSGSTYTRQVTIADGVISGNGSGLTSLNASNISSGTLSADRLATSGVTAGSYGPSANATPGYGATFNVPYITVDAKGRVTAISTKTVKIPASDNTNTTYTFATGDTNGTFKVTPSGGTATNIAIKGLGSAAYTASSAYAAASHTHNYAGSSTAGGPATLIAMPRVTKDSKVFPGQNRVKFEEYTAGDSYNLPTNAWYHIISMQGSDTRYGTQIAVGMTANKRMYFRNYNESSWQDWTRVSIDGHTHSYLPLAGGTMTGKITCAANQTGNDYTSGCIDCKNSNIVGINSLVFADLADSAGEGLQFYRTTTTVDTIWVKNGVIYFTPNRTLGGSTDATNYTVLHSNNYSSYALPKTTKYALSSSVGGPAYSVEGSEGTDASFRHVWFSTSNTETRRAYSDKFMFEPASGILKFNSWYPLDITDNTVDLNSYNDGSGKYGYRRYICRSTGGGNKISNKPCDSPFLLEVFLIRFATASSDYITKQVYHAFNKKTYQRFCTNGTWDSWTELKYTDTNTDTKNTAGSTNTSSKIFLIGATSQAANPQTYSHDTAYVGTDGCLYSNSKKVSVEGHAHGLGHSNFTVAIDSTTNTWAAIGVDGTNKYVLKSIRTNTNAPPYLLNDFSAGIVFGGEDTRGVISMKYDTPSIRFAGGNRTAADGGTAKWYITLTGTHNTTYNLDTMHQVTQTATTTSAAYEVLFSGTADNTTRTEGTRKNSNLTFNPSTGVLTATKFDGKINGKSYSEFDPTSTSTNRHCLLFYQDKMETSSGKVGADLLLDYDTIQGVLNSPGLHCGVLDALSIYISGTGDDSGIHYKGTKASYNMIKFVDNTVDTYGNGIVIGGGGLVVMGAGESADNLVSALSLTGGQEKLYLTSDSEIYFYVNCNTIGDRKGITLNTSLSFYPNSNNTGTIGTSSNKWNAMYATTFYGAFSGSGASVTSLNASNISSGTLSADRLATSGVTAGSYGPSTNVSPAHSGTFNVPYITVDNKGRVMAIATRTITLPASGNTDANVKQSATSTANFRGVILGTNNTVNTGDTRETTVTGQGYITNKIFAQPSTGNLYASNIYAYVNGTDEVRITLYRSGNSSWRFVNNGGTLSLQNNYYNSAVQSWYTVAQFDYSGTNSIKFTTPPQRTGTNRSTTYGYGGISMAICSKNSWAMGMSWLNNARDTIRGEFAAYGTADKLTYYYWGTAHNATKLRLYPGTGGGLVSQQSNGFRIAANGYGVIFRVDSDSFYILLTDKKTDGSELTGDNWNSKRPLQIGLSSGVCNINGTASTAKKLKYCTLCNEASDAASYPWYRMAYAYTTGAYSDLNLVMMVTCGYGSKWGIFKARARIEGTAGTFGGTVTIEWIVNNGFTNAQLYLLTKNNYQVDTAKSGTATAEIWFKSDGRYWGYTFTVLHEGWRTGTASDLWALSSYSKNGSESYNKNASSVKSATSSKIYSTNTPGSSSHAGYSIPFFSGPIDSSSPEKNDTAVSGNKTVLHNGEFRLGLLEGTTSADGYAQLVLGNGIASGTAGNKYGKITLYSSSTYAVQIIPAKVKGTRTLTLPDASGTVALTSHTHSYIPTSSAATLFSGTAAASITMTSMSGYTRLVVFCKNTSNSSYFTVELQCTTGYHYHAMTVSPPPAAQTSNSFYGLLFNLSSETKITVSAGKYSNLSSSASLANGPTVHITKVIGYKF